MVTMATNTISTNSKFLYMDIMPNVQHGVIVGVVWVMRCESWCDSGCGVGDEVWIMV